MRPFRYRFPLTLGKYNIQALIIGLTLGVVGDPDRL